jgi:Zn-dependent M28 family amino/carboxypeptidase
MQRNNTLTSFELQTKISFDGKFEERDFIGRNIIGMIEGSDDFFKDSFILLSAHYDHLGIGPPVKGDSVYNGVLDNALGVSSLMEICRIFSTSEVNTKRSIIFLWLTGEEKGLLGSSYYTDHPARPLHKTVAAINLDGIAAFEEFNDIIGVGSELSSLENDLIEVSSYSSLNIASMPDKYFYESESISRSDQFSFMKAGIPSVLITEGVKYKNTLYEQGIQRLIQWSENIYHSPFDDLSQEINFEASSQHTKFILDFAVYLGNKIDPPFWNPGSPYINARLQSIAEKR